MTKHKAASGLKCTDWFRHTISQTAKQPNSQTAKQPMIFLFHASVAIPQELFTRILWWVFLPTKSLVVDEGV
ncbi:hypothetical protein [Marinomonas pollencensis]|uniref:hypothetical protein n=1 Tax=Marinomonas pollencensis TaxID=491954 RepID=UPI000E269521|nr:hypothetical protein [Marinomonas pollencensis]